MSAADRTAPRVGTRPPPGARCPHSSSAHRPEDVAGTPRGAQRHGPADDQPHRAGSRLHSHRHPVPHRPSVGSPAVRPCARIAPRGCSAAAAQELGRRVLGQPSTPGGRRASGWAAGSGAAGRGRAASSGSRCRACPSRSGASSARRYRTAGTGRRAVGSRRPRTGGRADPCRLSVTRTPSTGSFQQASQLVTAVDWVVVMGTALEVCSGGCRWYA